MLCFQQFAQYAGKPSETHKKPYLLYLLHYPDNFACDVCWSRVPDFGSDGRGPVCGDLPSTPIRRRHALQRVHCPGHRYLGMWVFLALVCLVLFLKLAFCGSQDVNHFCEILKVACSDAWINEVFVFTGTAFISVGPLSLILVSYMHIVWAILKIRTEGCRKAFSTFSSHFCVWILLWHSCNGLFVSRR